MSRPITRSEHRNRLGTHPLFRSRMMLLAAIVCSFPRVTEAQLTTGLLEATVRDAAGRAAAGIQIQVAGGGGFEVSIHTNRAGQFVLSLLMVITSFRAAVRGRKQASQLL